MSITTVIKMACIFLKKVSPKLVPLNESTPDITVEELELPILEPVFFIVSVT